MLFTEFRFFWFFLAVFAVYWSLPQNRSRKVWLLVCSYLFYACWNWKFLFLLAGSSLLDYVVGVGLSRTENAGARRAWATVGLMAACVMVAIGWASMTISKSRVETQNLREKTASAVDSSDRWQKELNTTIFLSPPGWHLSNGLDCPPACTHSTS